MHEVFAFLPSEVWQDHRLTLIETRVLACLFSFRGRDTNMVWPSRSTLAERSGYSESSVSRGVSGLKAKGWLIVTQRRGPNHYHIRVPDLAEPASFAEPASPDTVAEPATPKPDTVAEPAKDTVAEPATPELKKQLTSRSRATNQSNARAREEGFAEFREAWPKGKWAGGRKPLESWVKHGCAERWRIIVEDVKARKRDDRKWLEGFVPMPCTYLNQHRWTDDIDTGRAIKSRQDDDWRERFDRGEDVLRPESGRVIDGERLA